MKKLLYFILTIFLCIWTTQAYKELIIENIDGKAVRVIKVVLDWEHYIVNSIAFTWWDTLENLTKKVGWSTSINWVFFCPEDYSSCDQTHTISERVFLGEWEKYSTYRGDTWIRWIFGFDKDWEPLFVQKNMWYMEWLQLNTNAYKIDKLYFWLWNFPVLLINWNDVLWWSEHLFDKKMKASANKHFICSTKDKSTIYMWVIWGATMYEMPGFLKRNFNCYFAINLDAGMSAGMIYNWSVLQRWGRRKIMDAYVVLTRYEYEKLTNTIPPKKEKYKQKKQYIFTQKDKQKVQYLHILFNRIINKHGKQTKQKLIKYLRRQISLDIISTQKKSIYKVLLISLFTIDKL